MSVTRESLKYLITIANNEDLTNVLKEYEEFNTSYGPIARLHLFVLPKTPSVMIFDKVLRALIKITTAKSAERETANMTTNRRRYHKRTRLSTNYGSKRRYYVSLLPKKLNALKKKPQMRVETNLSFSHCHPNL